MPAGNNTYTGGTTIYGAAFGDRTGDSINLDSNFAIMQSGSRLGWGAEALTFFFGRYGWAVYSHVVP